MKSLDQSVRTAHSRIRDPPSVILVEIFTFVEPKVRRQGQVVSKRWYKGLTSTHVEGKGRQQTS